LRNKDEKTEKSKIVRKEVGDSVSIGEDIPFKR
jgi:hypothetical protein